MGSIGSGSWLSEWTSMVHLQGGCHGQVKETVSHKQWQLSRYTCGMAQTQHSKTFRLLFWLFLEVHKATRSKEFQRQILGDRSHDNDFLSLLFRLDFFVLMKNHVQAISNCFLREFLLQSMKAVPFCCPVFSFQFISGCQGQDILQVGFCTYVHA